jgi:hypothetical protein
VQYIPVLADAVVGKLLELSHSVVASFVGKLLELSHSVVASIVGKLLELSHSVVASTEDTVVIEGRGDASRCTHLIEALERGPALGDHALGLQLTEGSIEFTQAED